jgi:hypothetical protein
MTKLSQDIRCPSRNSECVPVEHKDRTFLRLQHKYAHAVSVSSFWFPVPEKILQWHAFWCGQPEFRQRRFSSRFRSFSHEQFLRLKKSSSIGKRILFIKLTFPVFVTKIRSYSYRTINVSMILITIHMQSLYERATRHGIWCYIFFQFLVSFLK